MSDLNNISKFIALNEFCLLEYEFNRDNVLTSLINLSPSIGVRLGNKQYYNNSNSIGITNNSIEFNSLPINVNRDKWYTTNNQQIFESQFDIDTSIVNISNTSYQHDSIKLHIISGYNFDDITGFLMQIRVEDASSNFADLSNFTYRKQTYDSSIVSSPSDIIKFNPNSIYLANKFYDKYIEFKIPSVFQLGIDNITNLGLELNVKQSSDVYINFSTINTINLAGDYLLNENISLQIPVKSAADSFNCFIAEASEGDFIKFYATWNNQIIGQYMGEIESGRISLYMSNNPNDNYESFSDLYGTDAAKWVINHEIYVWEHINETQLLTQKYTFSQDGNFSAPNYFRPVLKTADIDTSYSIQYVCRLTNRMDGTQIIRKASFSSMDPQKYGLRFTRLHVENLIPYRVYNKIEAEKANIQITSGTSQTKYIQVYYDSTNIVFNLDNVIYEQGTGPLFLKNMDSIYKIKLQKYDVIGSNKQNFDLSGVYNYAIVFVKDDGNSIEILPTYSTNMNTALGELEFKINSTDIIALLKQINNDFSIIVKNSNGSSYSIYQGKYYAYSNKSTILSNFNSINNVSDLQKMIIDLQTQIVSLKKEILILSQ